MTNDDDDDDGDDDSDGDGDGDDHDDHDGDAVERQHRSEPVCAWRRARKQRSSTTVPRQGIP